MIPMIVFWLASGFVLYIYAGYPLVLVLLRTLVPRRAGRDTRTSPQGGGTPVVSLLVAAYNEGDVIEAKIRNALALEYDADSLEIVVASDGSRDATAEIVRRFTDNVRIRLFDYPVNRGKLQVLNDTVPHLRGEIIAFSDASSMLVPEAINRLVAHFADPRIGGVSGLYKVTERNEASDGVQEDLYWRYETFVKFQETTLGSTLGCHGSLYAIRRSLYPFPDPRTINDDFVIPLRVVQQGYRIAYEPAAVSREKAKEMSGFSRRVRIMTGNVFQLRELVALLRPFRPLEVFFFLSHKAGRLVVPWAMIAALIANLMLLDRAFYRWCLGLQLGFYALAVAGAALSLHPRLLRLPYYFCMINLAAVLGSYFALFRQKAVVWK
jgi:glycosyltransferase involved in cell wall biosynthesis